MKQKVLSIQSHVVYGYVGNKSATFPLQLLGFEVDAINSVQFSNHTGYKNFKGQVLKDSNLDDLMLGLSMNSLDTSYSHLLVGYVGDASFLHCVVKNVKILKEKNSNLIFVCDPVLGDGGKLYVPKELVPIYQNVVIRIADILTPNQTELQLLTGVPANTLQSVLKGVDILHNNGCKIVVVTSAEFSENDKLLTIIGSRDEDDVLALVEVPKLKTAFTGTGDLFTALFLAWMDKFDNDICSALEYTVSTVHAILQKTEEHILAGNSGCTIREKELKLIQCKSEIEQPKILFKCRRVAKNVEK